MKNLAYNISNQKFDCSISGETEIGIEKVLLQDDINLIGHTSWAQEGYCIVDFVTDEQYDLIVAGITKRLADQIMEFGGKIDAEFSLERYHLYVTDEIHLKIARSTSDGWETASFPLDFSVINNRLSQILGTEVHEAMPPNFEKLFCLRLVRPNRSSDNNPPHRDVWLDILRNAVNIYVPLAGSNENSALPLLPGSHLFPENVLVRSSKGAIVNGSQYTVPCVVSVNNQEFTLIRPNPAPNKVMVFSPYMVHGGGSNLNTDITRVSLEIRFWKHQTIATN